MVLMRMMATLKMVTLMFTKTIVMLTEAAQTVFVQLRRHNVVTNQYNAVQYCWSWREHEELTTRSLFWQIRPWSTFPTLHPGLPMMLDYRNPWHHHHHHHHHQQHHDHHHHQNDHHQSPYMIDYPSQSHIQSHSIPTWRGKFAGESR